MTPFLYNWLPNDPQFSGFFTPMTLLLLHLVRNGLVFTRVVYWMTPYFGEYTFYLIGPYFWLGVGTYLSLQIWSAPPPWDWATRELTGLLALQWIKKKMLAVLCVYFVKYNNCSSWAFSQDLSGYFSEKGGEKTT